MLYKHENLSLDPRHSLKKLNTEASVNNPSGDRERISEDKILENH